MPKDDHWLASFEVVPPQKLVFPQQKNENSRFPMENGILTPTFGGKKSNPISFFFGCFCRKLCHALANNKRSCSKNWKKSGQNIAFLLFFRRKLWHDFVTPCSTFANVKGSLSTKPTTPNRLWWRARPSDEDFTVFGGEKHYWKKFFFRVRYLVLIYTPKVAHSRIFATGRSVFARQKLAKKNHSAAASW